MQIKSPHPPAWTGRAHDDLDAILAALWDQELSRASALTIHRVALPAAPHRLGGARTPLTGPKKFGCTHDELKAAVKKVGVMAKDVEAELKRSKGR